MDASLPSQASKVPGATLFALCWLTRSGTHIQAHSGTRDGTRTMNAMGFLNPRPASGLFSCRCRRKGTHRQRSLAFWAESVHWARSPPTHATNARHCNIKDAGWPCCVVVCLCQPTITTALQCASGYSASGAYVAPPAATGAQSAQKSTRAHRALLPQDALAPDVHVSVRPASVYASHSNGIA